MSGQGEDGPDVWLPDSPAAPAVRVSEPMTVMWQGVEHPVAAWDVHGFVLERPIPRLLGPGAGRVADLTLLIGPRGTRIEMQVQAKARDTADPQPLEFRFIDLDRAQAEVLHRIVEAALDRRAMSLTRLLNETEAVRTARQTTQTKLRWLRRWVHLGLAGAALTLAGSLAWTNLTTVRARYAAVTAGATAVSAPMVGTVAAVLVAPGQRVAAGEVLARVRPADADRRIEDIEAALRQLEAEAAELAARQGALATAAALAGTDAGSERARLTEALRLAERRLAVEREALAHIRANGLPSPERQARRARQEAEVLAAEQAVLAAQGRLAALEQAEALAGLGVVPGAGRDGLGAQQALDLRGRHLQAEIDRMRHRRTELAAGEPVRSPCDCRVTLVDRRPGEWTDPARPMVTLAADEAATVHALVPADRARSVRIGDRARIELADGTRLGGRVARLDYAAHWPGYTGLQDNVFAADRYARVEIRPERPIAQPLGMTAEVGIDTGRALAPILRFVGL